MTLNQHKIENYVMIASLKSETMGKLIKSIPGSYQFDIKFTRLGFEIAMSSSILKALPGTLDIKGFSPSILFCC